MEILNLNQLSQRTGVSEEKLRRAIDSGLTWRSWFLTELADSQPDQIDTIAGVYAVLAALLSDIGSTPEGVRQQMKAITALRRRERNPLNLPLLADAITSNVSAVVQIGDGTHVKWRLHEKTVDWRRLPTMEPTPDYQPLVVVAIDVARVRDMVRGARPPLDNN